MELTDGLVFAEVDAGFGRRLANCLHVVGRPPFDRRPDDGEVVASDAAQAFGAQWLADVFLGGALPLGGRFRFGAPLLGFTRQISDLGDELRIRQLGDRLCRHGMANDAARAVKGAELAFAPAGDPAFWLQLLRFLCGEDCRGAALGVCEDLRLEAHDEFDHVVEKASVGLADQCHFRPVRRQFAEQANLHLCLEGVLGLRRIELDSRIDSLALDDDAAVAADIGNAD